MANDRISQLPAEAVVQPDDAEARTTQLPVETVVAPTSAKARTTQATVETVVAPTSAKARTTQLAVEVVIGAPTGDVLSVDLIDQTAVAFAPRVRYTQEISLGLINQAAVAHAPNLTDHEINLDLILGFATTFAPSISTGVIALPLINQTAIARAPVITVAFDVNVDLGRIDRTAVAHPLRVAQSLQPGGEVIQAPNVVELLYDGVDIIDDVVLADATFTTQVNGIPGSCRVRIKDTPNTAAFVAGKTLVLRVNHENVWRGYVAMIHRTFAFDAEDRSAPKERFFILDGFDVNILFRKRIVFNQDDPVDLVGPTYSANNTWDTAAFNDLFSRFLDLSGDDLDIDDLIEHVGYVNIDHPAAPIQPSGTWENTMRGITSLTNSLFYIDPDLHVVHTDVDTPNAPYALSDQPGVGAVGYRQMEVVNDGTGLVNDALIWGLALGGDDVVIARDEDAASIAEHGRWQLGELQGGMYKQGTVDRRAASIVDGSPLSKRGAKNDKVSVVCTVFTDGFRAAQKVDFSSEVFDFQDVIPIRRMDITFVNPHALRYRLYLSHEIDMPWGFFDNYMYRFNLPDIPMIDLGGVDKPQPPDTICYPEGHLIWNVTPGGTASCGTTSDTTTCHAGAAYLYDGATYRATFSVTHMAGSYGTVASVIRMPPFGVHALSFYMGASIYGDAITSASGLFTAASFAPNPGAYYGIQMYQNVPGSPPWPIVSGIVTFSYVSGGDPRFEGLTMCEPGQTPFTGNRVEIVAGGISTTFTLPTPYQPDTTQVFVDGVFQRRGHEYTESDPEAGEITFASAPADGALIVVLYVMAIP